MANPHRSDYALRVMHIARHLVVVLLLVLASPPLRAAEPQTIPPDENLVVDGIPPIPAELVDQVGRYTEARAAGFAAWHPTLPEMLILTRFADTNQVHVVAQPGGARTQLTFFPDRILSATVSPTKGDYFIFTKSAGGNEFNQNYRYDFATGDVTLLTDGKSRNSEPEWSSKGDRIAYTSTRRNGADTDIYVQAPTDAKSDRLLAELKGGGWQVLDWSPDDKQLLVLEYVSINESYLWLFDTESGAKKEITPRPAEGAEKVSYGKALFSKDSKGVFATTDRESEFQRLAYIELPSGKHSYLLPNPKWDVDDWDLSHDGNRIAYTLNEAGVSSLHMLDVSAREKALTARPLPDPEFTPALGSVVISGLKFHRDPKQYLLAFNVAGARSPSDVYTWSLADRKSLTARWTASETGGIPAAQFVQPELVKWKSFDDREISGFLYTPDAAKFPGKRPLIINIHGGPESQYRPGFLGRNNYFLNELGCAILLPNVRGSAGYGKSFVQLDNGLKREDSYKDISALLDWIPEPAATRRRSRHGHRRLLRRLHDARRRLELRRSHPLRARRRRHLEPRHLPQEHRELSPRPAPRRVRRRARSGHGRIHGTHRALEQRRQNHQAPLRRARRERSARAKNRSHPNRRHAQEARHARLVPDGERRRPRLREKEKRRLPVLRHDPIHPRVSVEIADAAGLQTSEPPSDAATSSRAAQTAEGSRNGTGEFP